MPGNLTRALAGEPVGTLIHGMIRHEGEPLLGEHTDEIMRDVLIFDGSRIAEIKASGALGGAPARAAAE